MYLLPSESFRAPEQLRATRTGPFSSIEQVEDASCCELYLVVQVELNVQIVPAELLTNVGPINTTPSEVEMLLSMMVLALQTTLCRTSKWAFCTVKVHPPVPVAMVIVVPLSVAML